MMLVIAAAPIDELRRMADERRRDPEVAGPVTITRPRRRMTLEEFRAATTDDLLVSVETVEQFRARRCLERCSWCYSWDARENLESKEHTCVFSKSTSERPAFLNGVDAYYGARSARRAE